MNTCSRSAYVTCTALDGSEKDRIDGENHQGSRAVMLCDAPAGAVHWAVVCGVYGVGAAALRVGRGVALAAEWRVRETQS